MRNIILGTVAGLLIGSIGALAYSHYLGDGSLLADLQAKLDAANAALAASDAKKKDLTRENSDLTSNLEQLQNDSNQMKQQGQTNAPAATQLTPPAGDMAAVASVLRDMFRGGGGFRSPQQRMLLFQTRLKLSPEQAEKITAAMEADDRARRDMMRQMFQNGGKVDPKAAAAANTLDTTMQQVLNPEQQRQYAQLQTDEKNARADTMANSQVNSVAPLLQLSDSQKDQVYSALYQTQQSAPDPTSLMGNPNAFAAMKAQADATTAAMQKVLTPDQMSLYQQEQSMGYQPGRGRGGNNGGGNGATAQGGAQGGGATASGATTQGAITFTPVTTTPAVVNPGGTVTPGAPVSGYVATPAVTNDAGTATPPASTTDSSTNAATTNAAPTTNAPPSQ